ncbi:hypothetical protein B5E84_09825 [Lachnoclostridium sp. An14]|uniref:hypothetical protein n=1 Tax=Lachnoclostridium sp. An14 TaxID=1965562 RepID=UPI000B38844B|nr:hypothetical protein [Lachnoclostridium sp. An14]OUQ17625.1 hypothetical protein B5E84_09825 [Lachnoclostridium sp. An14]
MDEKYEKSIHRLGRIGVIVGILFMLGIPAVVSAVYDVWPESFGQLLAVGAGLLAVYIPTNVSEVFGYTPILGSASYITFLTGNVTQLKIPVVVNAQALAEAAQGTDEGDTVAAISVAVSSAVTTLVIVAGVILLVPLRPVLTSPTVQTATTYLLPALFGGLFLNYVNDNCGEYRAKNKTLTLIVPILAVLLVNQFYPLSGKQGYVVIGCMALSVACAYVLYKTGIIKMSEKKKG